ncbi:MAG: ATP synthase F1 subunit gamma [Bdellovibrio sp.]|nr:MAG: ATP synthase F1 subunit gamma [Bdellovibrio sp.]
MANLKDIRARIDSTKNTQQITRAMKLVSASKLRKAQHQIVNMRPYAHSLLKVIANIAATERVNHPLITVKPEVKKVLLIVISSDRGLCGSFNSSINKFTENYLRQNQEKYEKLDILCIGRKASDYLLRRRVTVSETMTRLDKDICYALASQMADRAMKHYIKNEYDEIRFIYNEFKSAISQKVVTETLLPVDLAKVKPEEAENIFPPFSNDMLFEPHPDRMIDQLLVKHFSVQVFRCMAESVAAEHGARMTAMENATNNAKEVLAKLTLTYNKARQEKITTELIEIVSGAEAL